MEDFLVVFKQIHGQLFAGERPSISSQDLAKFLYSDMYMKDISDRSTDFNLSTDQRNWVHFTQPTTIDATLPFMPLLPEDSHGKQPSESAVNVNGNKNEILMLQMTLIQMINSKVHSRAMEEDTRETYTKAIRILLEDTEIISKLILLFKHSNQLLSHVAMKCVSSLILFQILTTDLSCDSCFKTCLQTFSEDPQNPLSAKCLETVAGVLKGVLEGKIPNKTVIIMKLLTPLDAVFDDLYTFMFSTNFIDSRTNNAAESSERAFDSTNNLLAIIDILEVFIAIRIQLKLNCSCLRTLYIQTAYVLDFINSSAHYFVKKKLLLVIKQCVLCQFGEKFGESSSCMLPQQDINLQGDLLAVSNAILQILVSSWLEKVPVSPMTYLFGGNEIIGDEDSNRGPDLVMLRTVSLIVVKALEIKVKNWTFEGENKESLNVQLQTCIHQLMMFIRIHLKSPAHSKRLTHSCAWVSLVFLEQDDDMVEAARALLNIYIHSVRFFDVYHDERGVNSLNAHESCFNPHCIFLLLLNNLTFDHCVLLDFLISTETCFLEYFVRYLKLLREEWQHFLCICHRFDEAELIHLPVANEDSKHSDGEKQERTIAGTESSKEYPWEHMPQSVLNLSACHILTPEEEQRKDKDTSDNSKCGILINSSMFCLGGQSQGLVDYANSEDSDSESVEVPDFNIHSQEANPVNNSKKTKLVGVDPMEVSEKMKCYLDTTDPGNLSLHYCGEKNTNMGASSGAVFNKSVTCLIELRKTIARLQGRNIFPYNATALLKLLFQIEALSGTTEHE